MPTRQLLLLVVLPWSLASAADRPPLSDETQACLDCHRELHPGLVGDWRRSRHSQTTPAAGLARPELERRVSAQTVPEAVKNVAVGCFECHGQNPAEHPDSFDHFGTQIHTVVSPNDCRTCHPVETEQFADSKKAHAVDNLEQNPVFMQLVDSALGMTHFQAGKLTQQPATDDAKLQGCFGCHGAKVEVIGTKTVNSALAGEVEVPRLSNWPSQGVGRINPDGSRGACSACHARHEFSLEVARRPETCGQCHLEPDVPARDVYRESKHGNLYEAVGHSWNFKDVPWQPGVDFTAPTCATCHSSLLATAEGVVLAERSHDFGARLWVRIFGLPYAHPQPTHGATSVLRNDAGLPLPTSLTGEPDAIGLLTAAEQQARRDKMQAVCSACHSRNWSDEHLARLDRVVVETNAAVLASTKLMQYGWDHKLADPSNLFDEVSERKWVQSWLFDANSIRYAAAMNGPDYASFENGWWQLNTELRELGELFGLGR